MNATVETVSSERSESTGLPYFAEVREYATSLCDRVLDGAPQEVLQLVEPSRPLLEHLIAVNRLFSMGQDGFKAAKFTFLEQLVENREWDSIVGAEKSQLVALLRFWEIGEIEFRVYLRDKSFLERFVQDQEKAVNTEALGILGIDATIIETSLVGELCAFTTISSRNKNT